MMTKITDIIEIKEWSVTTLLGWDKDGKAYTLSLDESGIPTASMWERNKKYDMNIKAGPDTLNDIHKWSFDQIADLLEKEFNGVN